MKWNDIIGWKNITVIVISIIICTLFNVYSMDFIPMVIIIAIMVTILTLVMEILF